MAAAGPGRSGRAGARRDRALCGGLAERGYGPWGVFRDGRLIGHGGLNFVPEFGETEVLWALHPDAWGKGYATEVARAALGYGFDDAGAGADLRHHPAGQPSPRRR